MREAEADGFLLHQGRAVNRTRLAYGTLLGLIGCAGTPASLGERRASPEPTTPRCRAPIAEELRQPDRWWTEDFASLCGDGAEVVAPGSDQGCWDPARKRFNGPMAHFYEDGTIAEERWYDRGKLHGRLRAWDRHGQLKREMSFRNGKLDGTTRLWLGGTLVVEATYEEGAAPCGVWKTWYDDGSRKSEAPYVAGRLDGVYRSWHPSGEEALEGPYVDGNLEGTWRQWDDHGTLLGSFEMKHGHGTFQRWHPSGKLRMEGAYRDGKMHGTWTQWNPSGVVLGSFEMTDGDGTYSEWFEDGRLAVEGEMRGGARDDTWTWWAPDDTIARDVTYENEVLGGRAEPWTGDP